MSTIEHPAGTTRTASSHPTAPPTEEHTAMSAQPIVSARQNGTPTHITPTPITPTRYLNIDVLTIPADAPYLMRGDVIHVEATLQVCGVTDGLDHEGGPRSIIRARANGTPEVVIRSATLVVGKATVDAPQDAPSAPQGRRGGIRAWWSNPNVRATLSGAFFAAAWSASLVALAMMLAGCSNISAPRTSEGVPVVQWERYAPTVRPRIDAGTCESLAAEFEVANTRRDVPLMKYIDYTQRQRKCFG